MDKPAVYLDTNIISAYWFDGDDVMAMARRTRTTEWWDRERRHFSLFVSITTLNELQAGSYPRQADCLKMAGTLARLAMRRRAKQVLDELLRSRLLPETKPGDALQMAVATAHEMDYLPTWNYAHLANPIAQKRLEEISQSLHLRAPLLVSPETIPQVRFGQQIRRKR